MDLNFNRNQSINLNFNCNLVPIIFIEILCINLAKSIGAINIIYFTLKKYSPYHVDFLIAYLCAMCK